MKRPTCLASLATISTLIMFPIHAEKAKAWQTGKVLESSDQRMSEITGIRSVPADGGASVERRQWDSDQFVIDAGDRIIWISQSIRRMGGSTISFRVGKSARLVPGDSVQFALEKGSAYVLVEGKEEKLHIDRIALKQTAKNASSAQTGAEFDAQLRSEFPEIVADSERMSRGLQPESEIFKCTGAIYRAAIASDPGLATSNGALLMAARQARAELKTGACAAH